MYLKRDLLGDKGLFLSRSSRLKPHDKKVSDWVKKFFFSVVALKLIAGICRIWIIPRKLQDFGVLSASTYYRPFQIQLYPYEF